MNKTFHQNAAILALGMMPDGFKKLMLVDGYTIDNLKYDAEVPDEVDKDNITQNAEIHHAHSYKMEMVDGKLTWIDGDALERLKGLCADAHDFKAENRITDLRYTMAKMTHYKVDSLTYPHLFKGQPWEKYHTKFENDLGKFIEKNQAKISGLVFKPYKDIFEDSKTQTMEIWNAGQDYVQALKNKKPIPDETNMAICVRCVQGIGDTWTTLFEQWI